MKDEKNITTESETEDGQRLLNNNRERHKIHLLIQYLLPFLFSFA